MAGSGCYPVMLRMLALAVVIMGLTVKGFLKISKPAVALIKEQVTAYGSSLQAGYGIQRTLALNH
jgi:hypothetical protein